MNAFICCSSYTRMPKYTRKKGRNGKVVEWKPRLGAGLKNCFWQMYGRNDAIYEGRIGKTASTLLHPERIEPLIYGKIGYNIVYLSKYLTCE